MTTKNFVDYVTPIDAAWLNDVDESTYVTVPGKAALEGSASQTFSVASATAATHAVRSDQLSADNTNFPFYTAPAAITLTLTQTGMTIGLSQDVQIVKVGKLAIISGVFTITSLSGTPSGEVAVSGFPQVAKYCSAAFREISVVGVEWNITIPANGTGGPLTAYNNTNVLANGMVFAFSLGCILA